MAKKLPTTWKIDPHTRAKHAILRRYLDAWLPIMTRWNGRVIFIDGFAGPGRYAGGEDGSPIIALKAASEQRHATPANLDFVFIENDHLRKQHLEQEIAALALPANITVHVEQGTWDATMTQMLDELRKSGGQIAPTFAFVDPFGWSHTPFATIKRLMANERCEVLINLMYEEINRFLSHPAHSTTWDKLFGTPGWRKALALKDPAQRRQLIYGLYERQLRQDANVRFVRSFEMRNDRDITDYFLFFATNSPKGLCKMKESMWRVSKSGGFMFSDATVPSQPVLFELEPAYHILRDQITSKYSGQTVTVEEVERFIIEESAFLPTHYKRQVLAKLETSTPPQITVLNPPTTRRRGTFPTGTRIRFA